MNRYLVTINQYETRNDVIYYAIRIEVQDSFKVLYKRYSDLKTFCEQVYQKNDEFKLKLTLPRFPKKKMFGRTKNSQNDIRIRGQELQQYLEIVLNIVALQSFQFLREFLPEIQQLDETCKLKQVDYEYSKDLCWLQMDQLKKSFLQRQDLFQQINKSQKKKKNNYEYYQRFHFEINEFSIQKDFVQYIIVLKDSKKTTKYQFETRYSNLRDFHQLLEKQQFKNILPNFPKRRLIGQTMDNPQQIVERKAQLQGYLNQIFSVKEFVESEALLYFITRIKLEGKSIRLDTAERISQSSQNTNVTSFNFGSEIDEVLEQKSF